MKKKGFTLAEVLISLGIIGVVSAITMPALTANYQKKTYESLAKKAYNTISVAIETYMAQEGVDDLLDSGLMGGRMEEESSDNTGAYDNNREVANKHAAALENFANNYFKVAQICGYANGGSYGTSGTTEYYSSMNKSCLAKSYKSLDRKKSVTSFSFGSGNDGGWFGGIVFSLVDGSSMIIASPVTPDTVSDNQVSSYRKKYADKALCVVVDTNGINGPNIFGRDLFYADVRSDGLVYDLTWRNTDSKSPDGWYDKYKSKTNPIGIGKLLADGWQMLY